MSSLIRLLALFLVLAAFAGCNKKKSLSGGGDAQDPAAGSSDAESVPDGEVAASQPGTDANGSGTGSGPSFEPLDAVNDLQMPGNDAEKSSSAGHAALPAEQVNAVNLIWKRYRAFENGLMEALELNKEQLCRELGEVSCVDEVSLSHLGGNDITKGQLSYVARPTAITPIAVDRIVLSACVARAELDQAAGPASAVLFKQFALDDAVVSETAAADLAKILYQRFLARDAGDEELNRARNFASQGLGARSVAIGLCYAIGTLSEGQFF